MGRPETEILAAARMAGADLIAMRTHGRSGLGRLALRLGGVLRHAEEDVWSAIAG